MNDILCPTVLTTASESALRWASAIATGSGQGITLLHVLEKHERHGDLTELKARVVAQAERFAGGINVRKEFPEGDPLKGIIAGSSQGHSLMVAGTHGPRGLRQSLFGADILKLVRHVAVPSLVMQADSPAPVVRRILLPVAGHKDISTLLDAVCLLARGFGAEVQVFQVMRPGEDPSAQLVKNKAAMTARFQAEKIPHREANVPSTVFSIGFAEQTIRYAQESGMDIIAIMAKASDEYRWIADAEKERLLMNGAHIPVLCAI